jgi:hypothetical protein
MTDIVHSRCSLFHINKIGIEFHQVQKCFRNKIKALYVSANDDHHRKATSTSEKLLHVYYMHVVLYGLH